MGTAMVSLPEDSCPPPRGEGLGVEAPAGAVERLALEHTAFETPTPAPSPQGGGGSILLLQTWLSPAFPVGAFGYSHGLERAIQDGAVADGDTLRAWVGTLLTHGGGWTDAVLLAAAHAADPGDLPALADLGDALSPSRERRAETMGLGTAFLSALASWPHVRPALSEAPYPVALGAAAASAGIGVHAVLTAYLNAFAAQLISVAVRLVPIGQSEGVGVLAGLHPLIAETAARATISSLDDLGGAALASDIASLTHETQRVRLFLS